MKPQNRVYLVFTIATLLSGCISVPKQEEKINETIYTCPSGKANVFFIRTDNELLRKFAIDVHIDNKKIASLMQKEFVRVIMDPGNHIINLYGHDGTLLYPVKLLANKNYYYQIDETQRNKKMEPSIGIIMLEFDAKMQIKNTKQAKIIQ